MVEAAVVACRYHAVRQRFKITTAIDGSWGDEFEVVLLGVTEETTVTFAVDDPDSTVKVCTCEALQHATRASAPAES